MIHASTMASAASILIGKLFSIYIEVIENQIA